ncbi:AAA family ATPase [Sinisalibacter lacisalsi]|uniref:GTP-binding protein n=1 Tax=Sinisalibacter lacisalsi TaxID=1526570 RepID=A0ABQ1QIH3_9RHOB|nr:AAA family ATPase [Sinisalibacter lacisalsi]GGD28837.1 GTP-binding protein [Sinisalibacter lacisalsi]
MKILSITLSDVRRFTSPIRVDGLDSGVNVLTAPNESGKSTLFDALQALFFLPHRSRAKEVKSLQPHAGGRPTVSVEIELPAGRYRITKRWLSGAMAEVHQDSRLVAKDDAAEEWIETQIRSDAAGGPAGLLWVRQGVTALDGDTGRAADDARSIRRDLLSSVAGEVEAMTGGRRMDRALARCTAELNELLTATGRPRAGGPLKAAEDEAADLETRESQLEALSRELSSAIEERRELRREAQDLRDPEQAAAAEAALDAARAALENARRHAEKVAQAGEKVDAAEKALAVATERRSAFAKMVRARDQAVSQAQTGKDAEDQAAAHLAARETTLAEAEDILKAARADLAGAERQHSAVIAAETAERERKQRDDLDKKLAAARELSRTIARAGKEARTGPDAKAIGKLDQALQSLRVQEALREQAALRVTMHYDQPGAPRVRLEDGAVLENERPHPLPAGGDLVFDGIGRLCIEPGTVDGQERDYERALEGFERALAATGAETPEEARRLAATRLEAETTLREAQATLAGVAPDGIAALEAARAALGDAGEDVPDPSAELPDRATAERAVEQARGAVETATEKLEGASRVVNEAKVAFATATADRKAADTRRAEAEAALDGVDLAAEQTERTDAVTRADAALAEAHAEAKRLAEAAPDLEVAEAAFKRAQSALTATEDRLQKLDRRLAELDTLIRLRAAEGVDEDLGEVRDRLAEARGRLERYSFERDVLSLLQAELDAARISAREHYFEPVSRELRPLLHVLWPDAELAFDDETILPTALTRNGQEESLDVLSGGTREQIALLVRLAFARLLAKSGRPAPVILDDALVFTDDDRIERMFDTLHRQAGDMQLIIFSCRQRAFRALGGKVLGFEPAKLPAEASA